MASGVLAVQIALDYAVYVQVRITSDRRSEVAVEFGCQAEMSGLSHRPQKKLVQYRQRRLVAYRIHKSYDIQRLYPSEEPS